MAGGLVVGRVGKEIEAQLVGLSDHANWPGTQMLGNSAYADPPSIASKRFCGSHHHWVALRFTPCDNEIWAGRPAVVVMNYSAFRRMNAR